MYQFPHKFFVIGSDTDVGKTLVSAVLTVGLGGNYWKPIQCGVSPCTDTEWVHEMTGLPHTHFLKEKFLFGDPIAPHAQHIGIELSDLIPKDLPKSKRPLIIEGSGGIMVPINEKHFFVDFIKEVGSPALLVLKNTKGAINQALLTIDKLKERGIPLFGIVLNGPRDDVNLKAIEQYCKPPKIFEMDFISHITENALKKAFEETFT